MILEKNKTLKKVILAKAGIHLFILVLLFLTGCGSPHTSGGEYYGDLMESPSGLALTAEDHGDGWQRADCSICHNFYNIHLQNSVEGYDMAEVRRIVEEEGQAACPTCHGTNGVE